LSAKAFSRRWLTFSRFIPQAVLPILSTQADAEVGKSARSPLGKPPMLRPQPRSRCKNQPELEFNIHTPDVRAVARAPSPLCVLVARAEARALLYAASDFDLPEAVDPLQAYAEESGLLDEIGQDGVQAILAVAFSKVNHAH
jgi:hypothetical protein